MQENLKFAEFVRNPENISDNAEIRKILREFIFDSAQIVTTLKPGEKYLIYQTYE